MSSEEPEPLSLKALAQELRAFGLHETCEKAEKMSETGEADTGDLYECLTDEYHRVTNSKDLVELYSAVEKMFENPSEEVMDLGNWYLLQKPSQGLGELYSMLKDLDVNDTKQYILLSAQILVIQWNLNVRAIYDFFQRNGGDEKQLDNYFKAFRNLPDGTPDLLHITDAVTKGNFSFIGQNALKFKDEATSFDDSLNLSNLTKVCNGLEIKIRLVSLVGHYHLVMKALGP